MRKQLQTLVAVLALAGPAATAQAQAPTWQTAIAIAQTGGQRMSVASTATDASGNILVAGNFDGTLTLGATTLTSAGGDDGFVAKWSPASQGFVWARRLGGPDADAAFALAVSGTSIYVAGTFENAASFGPVNLTASSTSDAFVAKLTDTGAAASFVWARQAGGTGTDDVAQVTKLAVSGPVVYAAGLFEGSFGAGPGTPIVSAGAGDGFVFKLTDTGPGATLGWQQRLGGPLEDVAFGLAAEGSNVYVAGLFAGTLSAGALRLTSGGDDDGFLIKLVDGGAAPTVAWGQTMGGPGNDALLAVAARGNNLYVAGAFSGTRTLGSTTLTSLGEEDVLVMKLRDTGPAATVTWATRGGGPGQDVPYALAVQGNNLFISGFFVGPATYGPSILNGSSAANDDILVARLVDGGSTGSFAWAQQASSANGNDYGNSLTISGGRLYVAGDTQLPATFGSLTLTGTPGTNADSGFLAALADPVLTSAAPRLEAAAATLVPNPASGAATLHLPARPAPATLSLTDNLGRVVRAQPVAAGATAVAVPLTGLPAGLYQVRVVGGGPTFSRKLAVE